MKKKQLISKIAILLLFLTGILVMLYPFYVDALNNTIDQFRVNRYLKEEKANFAAKEKELQKENDKRRKEGINPATVPFTDSKGKKVSEKYYKKHLIGTINIPELAIELPLFDTTNETLLQNGATVVDGTSFPLGGKSTHTVISGHRGLPERELFTNLPELKNGDVFILHVLGKNLAYEVYQKEVVKPDETSVLKIEEDKDIATLLTCTPYMINSHRLLVTGKRVPYTEVQKKAQDNGDLWRKIKRYLILAGTMAVILAILYALYRTIYNYQLRQQRFDFEVDFADASQVTLYDKKGKKAMYRNGRPYQITPDENGKLHFEQLPKNRYCVKAGKTKLFTFGVKKKKEVPKVYSVNQKLSHKQLTG